MLVEAELVLKSYIPDELELGMMFMRKTFPNTEREEIEVFSLSSIPEDNDEFYFMNGFPIQPYIIKQVNINDTNPLILASAEEIGWWDDGEETDELYTIDIDELNFIIGQLAGQVCIEINEELEEVELIEGMVVLTYPEEFFDED